MKGITYEEYFTKYVRKDGNVTLSEVKIWRATVHKNGKCIRLGSFKTEQEAIDCMNNYKQKNKANETK